MIDTGNDAENALRTAGLPGREAPGILRYAGEERFRTGKVLAWQDDRVERCFFVLEGNVIPLKYRAGAPAVGLKPVSRGGWVCLVELVAGSTALADYTVREELRCLVVPAVNLGALRERPGFERWLSLSLSREALSLHSLLAEGSVRSRIVSWLLSRKRSIAGVVSSSVSVTQAGIAACLGLTRETVNKHLAGLQSLGLITTGRGGIGIPDWEALEKLLAEE